MAARTFASLLAGRKTCAKAVEVNRVHPLRTHVSITYLLC